MIDIPYVNINESDIAPASTVHNVSVTVKSEMSIETCKVQHIQITHRGLW